MKKLIVILTALAFAVSTDAQNGRFGFIDYNQTLKMMPEYAAAQDSLRHIEEEYAEEIERSDTEFNRQYMEYIHGQKLMSASILQKRQKELQHLYDGSMEFKKAASDSIRAERARLLKPLKRKLSDAISKVGRKRGLDYVLDLASSPYLYVNEDKGMDITGDVCKVLGIKPKSVELNNDETDDISR